MPDGVVYWHAPSALPPNSLVQEVADFITPIMLIYIEKTHVCTKTTMFNVNTVTLLQQILVKKQVSSSKSGWVNFASVFLHIKAICCSCF